jgi:hypothetical protein
MPLLIFLSTGSELEYTVRFPKLNMWRVAWVPDKLYCGQWQCIAENYAVTIYLQGKTNWCKIGVYFFYSFWPTMRLRAVYEKTMQNSPEARLANPFRNLLVCRPPHNICKCINFFSNFRISWPQQAPPIFLQFSH